MAGGGGGGRPAAVSPTVNTSTVQHTNPTLDPTAGTTGGKGGSSANFQDTPQMYNPLNQASAMYGTASSPFGFNYGNQTGVDWSGLSQNTTGTNVQNQFTGGQFYDQYQTPPPTPEGGGGGAGGVPPNPGGGSVQGSALTQSEMADLQARADAGDVAAQDAIYNNQLAQTDSGAGAGGLWSSIRGHGDDAGSSIATGTQSNVGLQDHAIALGENMPGLIGAGTNAINNALNIAPQDPNQADNRTAQEVSIARHTQNWAEQAPDTPIELTEYTGPTINDNDDGPSHEEILAQHAALRERNQELGYNQTPAESAAAAGFDMNDPSTWVDNNDSRQKTNNDNDNDSGGTGGGK